jgi:ATP-dependent RNA helicase DeaD
MKNLRFSDLVLSKEIHRAIVDLGYEEATPIQSEAIPVMLSGKDVIGQSQTGTGKTAAFGIPAIEMMDPHSKKLQVMILCPTRELAIQVAEEMNKLARYKKDLTLLPVYGGQPIERQLKILKKGVQIIIGTPGRILDHLDRGTIDVTNVRLIVLDEADEMLDMGFREDIELILKNTPQQRQTVMFSATMSKPILELTKKYLTEPEHIKVIHEVMTVENTEQIYFEVKERNKLEVLSRIIDLHNLKLTLVFTNTKRCADELVERLQARGYSADALHGDMTQGNREKVMKKFRNGYVEILVATDVAARGLDVDDVEAVFNYDLPQDEEYYVHRIGRTGRAGKSGKAFSFVTSREINKLKDIQRFIKTKIKLSPIPSFDDVEEMRENQFIEEIKKSIDAGDLKKYEHLIEKITDDDYTTLEVAAALLKIKLSAEKKLEAEDFSQEPSSAPRQQRHGKEKKKGKPSSGGDNQNQVRLFLNVGKKDNVRPGDILGAIAGESGINGKKIGEIDIYDRFTFVNVPEKHVDEIIEAMTDKKIRKKKIHIEVAVEK